MTLGKKIPLSVDIALTVTLQPKMFKEVPPSQYRMSITELELMLLDITGRNYVIIPELTPKNGNVHYHIILKIPVTQLVQKKGPIYCIRNIFRNTKHFGYIDIKQCTDVQGWIQYMLKELDQTILMLDLSPEYKQTKLEEIKQYLKPVEA